MNGAVALLARAFLRRQWRGLLVATLLLALGGGGSLAALAGARRTATAADRALEDARTADVSVDIAGLDPARLDRVRALPQVADLSVYGYTPVRPVGTDLVPGVDLVGVLPLDGRASREMDRPVLEAGRLPAPDRFDEVSVNPVVADRLDVGVGDTIELESYSQPELLAVFESATPPPPTGARARVRVVGIGRDLSEISDVGDASFGVLLLSPAWFERFGAPFDHVEQYTGQAGLFRLLLRARLHGGEEAARPYLRSVAEIYGSDTTSLFAEARSDVFDKAETTIRVESLALLLCAIAAGIATVVAVSQALTRLQFLASVPAVEVARGIGLGRRDRARALLGPSGLAIGAGLVAALAVAAALSPLFPRGLAARFEPHPGLRVDATALLGGAAVLGVLALLACVVGAARSSRTAAVPAAAVPRARIPLARPEVGVGMRMALHTGRGVTRVPARQTVIGGIVGITGVVAAITFAASLDRLVTTPRLYGADFDATIPLQGDTGEGADAAEGQLAADSRIAGLTRYGLAEVQVAGDGVVASFHETVKGAPDVSVLRGRYPAGPNEAAVDPEEISGPGPAVGSTIRVAGGGAPVEVRVVGHLAGASDGLWMTDRAAARLGIEAMDEQGFNVTWAEGVDHDRANASLARRYAEVYPVSPDEAVGNLERVRGFPYALALLLAVLAAAAVGHLLASAVRRRNRDLAILKAFGFSRRRTRATVRWQAITVTAVAVVAGTVLGVVAGRGAWALVTSNVQVIFSPAVPPLGLIAATAAAFAVTLLVAAVPARLAARTPAAVVLRAE